MIPGGVSTKSDMIRPSRVLECCPSSGILGIMPVSRHFPEESLEMALRGRDFSVKVSKEEREDLGACSTAVEEEFGGYSLNLEGCGLEELEN